MTNKQRVLVTGANGFVGASLLRRLAEDQQSLRAVVRPGVRLPSYACERFEIEGLGSETDWAGAFDQVDVVVHTAARAHVMMETEADALGTYREVNVEGTRQLAVASAEAGVRRLVFLSSVKVNGERTSLGSRFSADDVPIPEDAYGQSKWEAERVLMEVSKKTGLEIVIIRPPLVYGPGVKGNFASMMKWVGKGAPLPLGAINNRRSLVALDNLVDLISVCIDRPAAADQVFLAGDGTDLSTSELLRRVGKAMGRPARLMPVPPRLLKLGAGMLGKGDMARRLLGSLQVDISKARDVLGWEPPVSVDEGLRRAVEPYVRSRDD